jgi:hypothetical protein
MPHLSQNNRQAIEKLKERYQLLPLDVTQSFSPRVITAITDYQSGSESESTQALELCRAFLNEKPFCSSDDCFEEFSRSPLISIVYELNHAGLLTGDLAQTNFDVATGKQDRDSVGFALRLLKNSDLLTPALAQANFDAVIRHQSPVLVALALDTLECAGLLIGDAGQTNRRALAGHQDPRGLALALSALHNADLLAGDSAQANRNAVAGHQYPYSVAEVLRLLKAAGLLTGDVAQANRDAAAGIQGQAFANALILLYQAGLLRGDVAQGNFDALILHSAILFHAGTVNWERIPAQQFTPVRFTALIEICQQHTDNPVADCARVISYINREILGINEPSATEAPRFNAAQSTHTASVHQSVSESAIRLMEKYAPQSTGIDLGDKFMALFMWLDSQPDLSDKVTVAKRCLQRLKAQHYDFIDRSSRVSMKQLLALFWIAIHDDKCRLCTLDDAKLQLIDGLYEIQREYNLSETGEDNGTVVDEPSCPAGAFNKIIEKGQGVHPDMVVDFISTVGFSLKLPLVVREEAMAYLKSRANSNLGLLIEAIKVEGNANSVGPIWAEIKDAVAGRMFEEFGFLFGSKKSTFEFGSAIAAGEFLALSPNNLSELDRLFAQVSQDGAASVAGIGGALAGFFAADASSRSNGNTGAAAPHPLI